MSHVLRSLFLFCLITSPLFAQSKIDTSRGDRMIAEYFRAETAKLSQRSLVDVKDWKAKREEYRLELLEMLGLDPLPKKTDLKAVVTGKVEHDEFTVEKVQFQSRPRLYVTGNLYVPKNLTKPAPAILYVCGHGRVKKDGISYGNKAHYQHHGAWFARNGYVCLTIDSLQLGEIEATHHGTYRYKMWWWNSRGYTPAGVEAWNCVRALDYLQSRKEVDGERLGVTGRSGGGAYSWWIAAIDDRIKAAVPVAGITDLENHVVDGTVEGHCDCMFKVNTHRWDYAKVAALVAPRPLLISNTDKDRIFPLDGVVRIHKKVRDVYRLYGAEMNLGLHITEGPHKDTQELRVHAFAWFNRFLKDDRSLISTQAEKLFEVEQLKVFKELPADERNTAIHDSFTVKPEFTVPDSADQWAKQRDAWMKSLREKVFGGWPDRAGFLQGEKVFNVDAHGIRFSAWDFTSQQHIRLRLYLAHRSGLDKPDLVVLNVLDDQAWTKWLSMMRVGFEKQLKGEVLPEADLEAFEKNKRMFRNTKWAMAYVAPRGVGPTAWDQSLKKQTQHRRRFMLLGQTLDGMRVWDVRRAVAAMRSVDSMGDVPLWLQSEREMAGVALYASLFEKDIARLDLWGLPASHREGATFLNVMRFLDMPQAVAMALERSQVRIYQEGEGNWEYAHGVAKLIKSDPKQLQIRAVRR